MCRHVRRRPGPPSRAAADQHGAHPGGRAARRCTHPAARALRDGRPGSPRASTTRSTSASGRMRTATRPGARRAVAAESTVPSPICPTSWPIGRRGVDPMAGLVAVDGGLPDHSHDGDGRPLRRPRRERRRADTGIPRDVLAPVFTLLTGVAARRHGQVAVVRALSRPQRAPDSCRLLMRPSSLTASRSSVSSAAVASILPRLNSSMSRPWTISQSPFDVVTG